MNSIAHSDLIIKILVSLVMLLVTLFWGQPQTRRFNASVKALIAPAPAVAATDSILVQWHGGLKVIEITR
jgi:lysophospholipid acyltransferase (LPLAT)-like uncharacterized protein